MVCFIDSNLYSSSIAGVGGSYYADKSSNSYSHSRT